LLAPQRGLIAIGKSQSKPHNNPPSPGGRGRGWGRKLFERPKADINAVVAAVRKMYDIRDDSLSSQGRMQGLSEARGLAAWATLELSSGKLRELATLLGRDSSTLTCAVRRTEHRRKNEPLIEEKTEQLRLELSSSQVLPHSPLLNGLD